MDAASLHAAQAPDAAAVAQALAAAAEAGEGASAIAGGPVPAPDGVERLLRREGLSERLLGPAQAATQEPSGAPLAGADPNAEAATLQQQGRPQAASEAAPHPRQEPNAANAAPGAGDFALPDAQLAPAVLVGLQVDPGIPWTLPPPMPQPLQARARGEDAAPEHEPSRETARDAEAEAQAQDEQTQTQDEPPALEPPLDAAAARLRTLLRTLQATLRSADVPAALRAAVDQWRRGRHVILACPQGPQAQGPAWVFTLAPRQPGPGEQATTTLAGPCFEAWLQWLQPPRAPHWCHARLVKEHHFWHGRRLVAADAAQATACGVQLGPLLAERRPGCAVTVRIGAARSFWNALGVQWSALLVVSSVPLAGCAAAVEEMS
ncbi:hypothetical protein [Azohydromonas caseinilytica]|uniref:Uncharacterized protein n=1 Tax=Azohydromonas caseinilytica TaxID=2728836 RepID=A0A848FJL3_9BURK|nr:hypothetical protein [Azohydromonas caseinilytica]NML18519.1 hypothetical protein [Azohydromonas caseinilytica]